MNYLEFYGLEQEPFSNAPVSRFYFQSNQHTEALMRLHRVASLTKYTESAFSILAGRGRVPAANGIPMPTARSTRKV